MYLGVLQVRSAEIRIDENGRGEGGEKEGGGKQKEENEITLKSNIL